MMCDVTTQRMKRIVFAHHIEKVLVESFVREQMAPMKTLAWALCLDSRARLKCSSRDLRKQTRTCMMTERLSLCLLLLFT